jgi:hypothetical protein
MKFYIAAYVGEKKRVTGIYKLLKKNGHQVTVEWTRGKPIAIKNRDRKPQKIQKIAVRDIGGVFQCDVFVLLSEPVAGRAKYVELGAAIAHNLIKGRPKIYILGKKTNQSVFYYHPAVKRVTSFDEILNEISGS